MGFNRRYVGEKLQGLIDGHIQNIGDALIFIFYIERIPIKPFAVTNIAGNVNIGQKMHLYANQAIAFTSFTTPALHIKAEASWFKPAHPCIGKIGEQITDKRKDSRICHGIGSRRPADEGGIQGT